MKKNAFLFLSILLLLSACKQSKEHAPDSGHEKLAGDYGKPLFTRLNTGQTGINFSNKIQDDIYSEKNVLAFHYFYVGSSVAFGDVNNDQKPDVFLGANDSESKLYLNKGNFQFEDITAKSGITTKGKFATGSTWADVNNDGWQDLYICYSGWQPDPVTRANELWINNGNGSFTEKAKEYGIDDQNHSINAAFLDYDKDGDLDLFVMNHATYYFVPLYLVYKDLENPAKFAAASSKLFRNDGPTAQGGMRFTNVTKEAGVLKYAYGLGLVIADINKDGWPDIYQASDFSVPDAMYINQKNGTFKDEAKTRTKHLPWFGMGCDIADFNNDTYPDLASVDMMADDHYRGKTLMASMDSDLFWALVKDKGYQYQYMFNTFQLNNGKGQFNDIAGLTHTQKTDWSWAALFMDFDNDGNKDYLVTNGFRRYTLDNDFQIAVKKAKEMNGGTVPNDQKAQLWKMIPEIPLPNLMYHNNGDLHFEKVTDAWGLQEPTYSNGAAVADIDGDGDLDLMINNIDQEVFIYRNESNTLTGNNYCRVQLQENGKWTNNCLLAKVEVQAGGVTQYVELQPQRGYMGCMENIAHFGIGKNQQVDQIVVTWMDGKQSIVKGSAANQLVRIDKKDAISAISGNSVMNTLFTESASGSPGFIHKENSFDDFKREVLMPHRQSMLGPFLAIGDVNGDQLDDYYVGGAAGQSGALYVQDVSGQFRVSTGQPWNVDALCEDMNALFVDVDGDQDQDLYVVSGGGGEFQAGSDPLQDRLYLNDGKGKFTKSLNAIPDTRASGSCVKAGDMDGDGDLDLFVGGRATPGSYPKPDRSYLLRNDGKGKFTDATAEIAPGLIEPGVVTDAIWMDFNQDQKLDLILCGEWMPVQYYVNKNGQLEDITATMPGKDIKGWFYHLNAADIDNDGDLDLLAGNIGTNNKFNPTPSKPLHLFWNDFDNNGVPDIVLSKIYKGNLVPMRGRQCSSQQMPFIKDKFPTYKAFATAKLEDVYGQDMLNKSLHYQVNDMQSYLLINNNGKFTPEPMHIHAQVAPINGSIIEDINGDGLKDILIGGNMFQTEVETVRYDAGEGCILIQNKEKGWIPMDVNHTGFQIPGDVKDVKKYRTKNGWGILATNNNGPVQAFHYNSSVVNSGSIGMK